MASAGSRPAPDVALAVAVVAGVTLWRLLTLAHDGTDLFVDEAQYWLWGQNPDWGYYSKPPMIAWLGRAVTGLAGSDAPFWVRMPGALLHALTAVLTGLAAARLFDARVGAWAAILYVTTPFATLGSWLFSTDSVMLPFFAAAFLAYVHLTERRSAGWALALGVATGLGFLSKYAMLYLPLMAALAALVLPRARIAWRDAGIAAIATLVVAAPNLIWNWRNGGTTVRHVAVENAGIGTSSLDPMRGAEFVASQFGVFGPILFGLLLLALWRVVRGRAAPLTAWLLLLSLPVVALMTVQAIRSHAFANWAVTAYVAGSVLVAAILVRDFPRLKWASLGLHLAIAAVLPLLYMFPNAVHLPNGRLAAERYLGRAALSREIAAAAQAAQLGTIVASDRAVLADLFYTLRDDDLTIRALPPENGHPRSYYEQSFALADPAAPVLLVHTGTAPDCPDGAAESLGDLTPAEGAHRGRTFHVSRVAAACLLAGPAS